MCGSVATGSIAPRSPTRSSAGSWPRPAIGRRPSGHSTRVCTRPSPPNSAVRRRSSSWGPIVPPIIPGNGGGWFAGPTGVIRAAREARWRASTTCPWSTSPGRMPWRTPGGSAMLCPPRASGNSPPAAASRASATRGATRRRPPSIPSPTPGRAHSLFPTAGPTATRRARRRSAAFRPMVTGLYDMAGNVWQWTSDWFRPGLATAAQLERGGPGREQALDPGEPGVAKHVIKGGSFLCAPNYCFRYRPAARSPGPPDSGAGHIGFRTVLRDPTPGGPA